MSNALLWLVDNDGDDDDDYDRATQDAILKKSKTMN